MRWPLTPDGVTRAALEACVGGPFAPGIEVGGLPDPGHPPSPLLDPSRYSEPFRLDTLSVDPGELTAGMALPWHADFQACTGSWWPVPRPASVFVSADTTPHAWTTIQDYGGMVRRWHELGFVVDEAGSLLEREACWHPVLMPRTQRLRLLGGPGNGIAHGVVAFDVVGARPQDTVDEPVVGRTRGVRGVATRVVRAPSGRARRVEIIVEVDGAGSSGPRTATLRDPTSRTTWQLPVERPARSREVATADRIDVVRLAHVEDRRGAGRGVAAAGIDGVPPGVVHRVPVLLSELDDHLEVVVHGPAGARLDVRLQSPLGQLVDARSAAEDDRVVHLSEDGATAFGVRLPIGPAGREEAEGVWHVLVRQAEPGPRRPGHRAVLAGMGAAGIGRPTIQPADAASTATPPVVYALVATTAGGPQLRVAADLDEGAGHVTVRVRLAGADRLRWTDTWVEILGDDDVRRDHELEAVDDRTFVGVVPFEAGVDTACRVRLCGASPAGHPLMRARTLVLADG